MKMSFVRHIAALFSLFRGPNSIFTTCLLVMLLSLPPAVAQESFTVSGTVFSPKDQHALPGATAMVLSIPDSSFVSGATSDSEGYFIVRKLESGSYTLKVSFVGHQPMHKPFDVDGRSLGLGMMLLKESATQLKMVDVVADRAKLKQNGDTTVYFADAVKLTKGASAAKLVGKMAGIKVANGGIQAQGENVLEITVNGKKFFHGDLETALKLLPAESVKNVEVFSYRNEESKATGMDEGNLGKTINIVTKDSFQKSAFGRGYVGAGANGEYQGGGNVSLMNNDKRLTLMYQSNNINQQQFAPEDVSEVSSMGVNYQPGISKINMGGLDFFTTLGEQTEVSGTYLVKNGDNHYTSTTIRDYLGNTNQDTRYYEESAERAKSTNHNLDLTLRHELGPRTSLVFQPRVAFNNYTGDRDFATQSESDQQINAESIASSSGFGKQLNISAPIQFYQGFEKKNRSLSVELTPMLNRGNSESTLDSKSTFYDFTTFTDSLYQERLNKVSNWGVSASARYTEPVGKKGRIGVRWQGNIDQDSSNDRVFKQPNYSQTDADPDSTLSNRFKSMNFSQKITPEYYFKSDKHLIKFGLGYEWSQLSSDQIYPDQVNIGRTYQAILPSATWRLQLNDSKRLSISYRTQNQAPNAFQLQTVADNSNPFQQYAGNPNLKPEYRQSLSANYSQINTEKGAVFLIGFNASQANNYYANSVVTAQNDTLINNRISLKKGGQLYQTVNMNNYLSAGLFVSFDRNVKFLQSNFTAGLGLNYSRMPGLTNGTQNWADMPQVELNLGLLSNFSEKIDFSITTRSSYETAMYSLKSDLNSAVFKQESELGVEWLVWRGIHFRLDVSHQILRSADALFNRDITLCNIGLGYKFLKDNQAEIRATVFDLFNDNTSINRYITELYSETQTTNVLNRYFMLTFSYRFTSSGQ